MRLGTKMLDLGIALAARWDSNGFQNRPIGIKRFEKVSRASSRAPFVRLLMRLNTKVVDLGMALAAKSASNDLQNNPSRIQISKKYLGRAFVRNSETDLLPICLSDNSWAPCFTV